MQRNEKIRIAVDANVWVSTLLSPTFRARVGIVFDSGYRLLVSEELFDDLESAVRKPYLAKQIDRRVYEALVFDLRTLSEPVEVRSVVDACRDPKDNFLLALAKDSEADYLITGDNDLLDMEEFEKTKIVTLTDFVAAFQ